MSPISRFLAACVLTSLISIPALSQRIGGARSRCRKATLNDTSTVLQQLAIEALKHEAVVHIAITIGAQGLKDTRLEVMGEAGEVFAHTPAGRKTLQQGSQFLVKQLQKHLQSNGYDLSKPFEICALPGTSQPLKELLPSDTLASFKPSNAELERTIREYPSRGRWALIGFDEKGLAKGIEDLDAHQDLRNFYPTNITYDAAQDLVTFDLYGSTFSLQTLADRCDFFFHGTWKITETFVLEDLRWQARWQINEPAGARYHARRLYGQDPCPPKQSPGSSNFPISAGGYTVHFPGAPTHRTNRFIPIPIDHNLTMSQPAQSWSYTPWGPSSPVYTFWYSPAILEVATPEDVHHLMDNLMTDPEFVDISEISYLDGRASYRQNNDGSATVKYFYVTPRGARLEPPQWDASHRLLNPDKSSPNKYMLQVDIPPNYRFGPRDFDFLSSFFKSEIGR